MSDGNDLLVMVPTRGRRAQCERLLKSFTDTATCADLAFVLDVDDQETYAGVDWGTAACGVLDPRAYLSEKLNKTAEAFVDSYRVLMWVGDDHVFRPPATEGGLPWDAAMLAVLADMGGTGWVYPDDKRRTDVPEIWMCSTDVVRELGWFYPPAVQHYYGDNSVAELGKRAGLIRFCPEAVVEHLHYQVNAETERDVVYRETESAFGQSDYQAFQAWRTDVLPHETARLRRRFSRDIDWVLSRVGGHGLAGAQAA